MQAITVKHSVSSTTGGTRYIATAAAGRASVGKDYGLSEDDNYAAAAIALCHKFGWSGTYVMGTTKNGDRVFVAASPGTTMHVPAHHPQAKHAKRANHAGGRRAAKRPAKRSARRNHCGY